MPQKSLLCLLAICACDPLLAAETECWTETITDQECDISPVICGDQQCDHAVTGWEDDPLNPNKEQPIITASCPPSTSGAFDINAQTKPNCEELVTSFGQGRSEQLTHECFKLRACALSCTLTTTVVGTANKRWKPGQGSGDPGVITVFAGYCNEGVQSGSSVTLQYYDCIGDVIEQCEEGGES